MWSRRIFSGAGRLPAKPLGELFRGAEDQVVLLKDVPQGTWSTPFADGVTIGKLIRHREPKNVLEIGTYLGFTTSIMALNAPGSTDITSVDIVQHDGPVHRTLSRRVTFLQSDFAAADFNGAVFDFIFIDADHQFNSALKDTIHAIGLVADSALIVWHDYAPWGLGTGFNGVPRLLEALSVEVPIYHIEGTTLGVLEISQRSTANIARELLARIEAETRA